MPVVDDILRFLDDLLEPERWEDYGPNGLQVPGRGAVELVVTGVSSQLELFQRAAAAGAGLVLVHHGLFWRGQPLALGRRQAERLRVLLSEQIGLAAYHLPLDAHPRVGNNALLIEALGARMAEPFGYGGDRPIGYVARFAEPGLAIEELVGRVRAVCQREPLLFAEGPTPVRTMGVISGGAARAVGAAIDLGLDAFLTGEPTEPVMAEAREGKIHFLAAGHYATETLGVQRLGELLVERFGVEHRFIDLPNPI